MKVQVWVATIAVLMLVAGQGLAQSLEKSYGEQCSTAVAKKTEMCQVMAKALMAKLQGEAGASDTPPGNAVASSPAAPLTAAELRGRWGFLLDFIGKPTFAINGETGTADTSSRWVLEWQTPGEVLVRRMLGPDGAELGKTTYAWKPSTAVVERDLPSLGLVQTFAVEPNGNFIGHVVSAGTIVREKWESLGDTGYAVSSESNDGHGWVLGNDAMWQLATSDALAGAAQSAALIGQIHKNKKLTAEVKAQMQGSMSDAEFDQYIADLEKKNQARTAEKRRRHQERSERFGQVMGAVYNGLVVANEVASANEASSRAALDATMAQAARRSEQSSDASITRPSPTGHGGEEPAAIQQRAHDAAGVAAARPLRFVMDIGLVNKPGDTVNPTCYSSVITRPGPPGWGAGGFLPEGSAAQARQHVEALKEQFIARCRASGRDITSDGNFHWTWNETRDGDQQVSDAHARYREDVTVALQ
jgi:hypothetical protein